MNLLIKSPGEKPGMYPIARRGKDLKYLSFTVVELGGALRDHEFETGDEEVSLDFYTGPVAVEAEGAWGRWSAEVAARPSIGEAHPMIYIPAGARVRLRTANGPARITIGGALGTPDRASGTPDRASGRSGGAPQLVSGDQIVTRTIGKDNWTRSVHTHIADNIDAAHLICGETVNRPGGWSSCPPHKHDRFEASEVPMEEVYYFQLEPRQGFGFMRVYSDPADAEQFDLAYAVEHGDTVLIPRGYHPVSACPGYTLNYTWILAGEGRTYGAWRDDPRHAWIKA